MDAKEFRRVGKEMIDFIADHKEGIDKLPVVPDVSPGKCYRLTSLCVSILQNQFNESVKTCYSGLHVIHTSDVLL